MESICYRHQQVLKWEKTRMDKICLSRAQILWDAKKMKKMSYPRFTKIIIDYFMSKDQSISRRNKMFWHTSRDGTMFTSMRCISRHEKTQVYGAILLKELTNQAMLESEAYKTYYAFASGEKIPKPNKKDFHISHESSSGDGVNTSRSDEEDDDENEFEEEVEINDDDCDDNDNEKTESDSDVILDPNKTNEEHDKEEAEYDDKFNLEEDENINEEEDDEVTTDLYKDVNVNLGNKYADMTYADQGATEQQHASHQSGFEKEEEDAHVTLTPVLDAQKTGGLTQSSFVSSDITSKLLSLANLSSPDNEIASLMDTTAYHATTILEITSSFTTPTPPPPPFFNVATPVIKKNVTKSLEAAVLTRSSSQPQSSYEATTTLSEFELTKILIVMIEKNKSFDVADYKGELYDALVKSYNTDKDIYESYGEVFTFKKSRDDKEKDQDPYAGSDRGTKRRKSSKDDESSRDSRSKEKKSSSKQQDQEFITRDNDEQPADKEVTKAEWFKKPKRPPTLDPD
uniref:Uncharacterized protein n=1 Tax=Tanacetum cinerariifolium TaxID=118510 RepID=A0A6L2MA18_TANCI|nr:hypothetical protein [Tanacetum cinerariifolium]